MDATNLRLLQLLHANARTTLRTLGEAVNLSINAVRDRIARMEAVGTIRGYQAVFHPNAQLEALVFLERDGTGIDPKPILRANPCVRGAYMGPGRFPLIVHVICHDPAAPAAGLDEALAGTGFVARSIQPGHHAQTDHNKAKAPFEKLDAADIQILDLLRLDGRSTIRKMALAVGLPETTVRDRLHRLEDNKILLGTRAIVDARALGFTREAWIIADVPANQRQAAATSILEHPNVLSVFCSTTDMARIAIHAVSSPHHPLMAVTDQARANYDMRVAMFLPVEEVLRSNATDVLPGLEKEGGWQDEANPTLPEPEVTN